MVVGLCKTFRKLSTPPLSLTHPTDNRGMEQHSARQEPARFLTITDTAEVLNISVSQAYALVRSSELPAIRIGERGQWRIERDVLESYIEAKYEESRRASLWNQSDFANIADFALPADQNRTSKS